MELDVWTIVSAVLGVVALVAGGLWKKGKGKLLQVYNLVQEILDVVESATLALEDDKITKEEVAGIKKEASEVKTAWQKLLGKE